ncbi:unnamed protein product [Urochloa decumbens]|uniref:Disease resistance protein At4g27190-like leucine-rich repeats domain-containing protein n=1 Tax=Urochloa decumbens TaxID=240449 RepID=A0ABC9BVG6_9POAL
MQRKIAQGLRLGPEIMAMFDEQDEEDDFNGFGLGSRDPIRSAAAVIDQTLRESRFIMIFLNGSDHEIPLTSTLGIPEYNDSIIIWTYSKRFVFTDYSLLRHTDVCLASYDGVEQLSSSEFIALLRDEAGSIVEFDRYPCVQDMDVTTVLDCCLYELVLGSYIFGMLAAHAPNYWICDGIIQGDRALETSNALHPLIKCKDNSMLDALFRNLKEDVKAPFLLVKNDDVVYEKRPYRWIFFMLLKYNNKALEDMEAILPGASSIFLAFKTNRPGLLPNGLLKCCSNLGVLVLFRCAFSFVSPPFLHCHTLRFLGLSFCIDDDNNNNAAELEGGGWACLQSLWVIDLKYTECAEMLLSEDNVELMANIVELNIEEVRLRIIKPNYDKAETSLSSDDIISGSFLMDKTKLEILDLSGNERGMRNLPASISKASHLQVLIVNHCYGLENVVVPNGLPSSLRSFSFDCSYDRNWSQGLPSVGANVIQASKISLQGCTRLDNLLIGRLHNLVELDLSGCAIKWCRVERCSSLHAVFPPGTSESNKLEIIWVSDLLMARCIWSKASIPERDMLLYRRNYLQSLRHLHLRSCPSIQFAVPVRWLPSFPSLETLHVIYCGQLRHVSEVDQGYNGDDVVRFPKLTTVHLHDLPALRQICEVGMIAPALKTIKGRRMPGERRPAVEDMEKDVWDALEWDGVDAGHHPSLYEAPMCSRYYKQSRLLKGTVLR